MYGHRTAYGSSTLYECKGTTTAGAVAVAGERKGGAPAAAAIRQFGRGLSVRTASNAAALAPRRH